ncbi:hypothetical protein BANRA_04219 [Acinetobacter baumannii]|nr:hypothetical protein BANRA_04219 [Acinetobacter baumannii]
MLIFSTVRTIYCVFNHLLLYTYTRYMVQTTMKSIWHMILLFLAIIALVTSSIFIVILNFYIQSTNTFIWLNFIVIAISLIYILSFIWNTFSELLKENDFKIIYVGTLLLFMSVLASGTYLHFILYVINRILPN